MNAERLHAAPNPGADNSSASGAAPSPRLDSMNGSASSKTLLTSPTPNEPTVQTNGGNDLVLLIDLLEALRVEANETLLRNQESKIVTSAEFQLKQLGVQYLPEGDEFEFETLAEFLDVLGVVIFDRQCRAFIEELLYVEEKLKCAKGISELPDVAASSHKMGGASAVFGASGLSKAFFELELLAKNGNTDALPLAQERLSAIAIRVSSGLLQILSNLKAPKDDSQ